MELFVLFTLFAFSFALDSQTVNNAKQSILDYLRDGGSPQKAVRLSMSIFLFYEYLRFNYFQITPTLIQL